MGSDRELVNAALHEARVIALRMAVRHHAALEATFLAFARRHPVEAPVWELAAEEQQLLAEEQREHLRGLGEEPPPRDTAAAGR